MRQVVAFDGLREAALRPRELVEHYGALLEQDRRRHFPDPSRFVAVACPGCLARESRPAFAKSAFTYVRCDGCGSVFVSPRPPAAAIREFTRTSAGIRYWAAVVEAETVRDRARSIVDPRAAWIQSGAEETPVAPKILVDVASKSVLFVERVARAGVFERVVIWNPELDPSAVQGLAGVTTASALDDLVGRVAVVSAQECLERDADPDRLVAEAGRLLAPGGLLFVTTLTWSGFDFQVLGGRSTAIRPPIHLNLLSLDGIRRLFDRHGFELVEVSATGQLDTEIVARAAAEDPALELPPFVDELIRRRDEPVHRAFQRFLQEALLSSHVRLVARRPAGRQPEDA